MKTYLKFTLLVLSTVTFGFAGPNINSMKAMSLNDLSTIIHKKFVSEKGTFALAFKVIGQKDKTILINENEIFHAASTMKTPVMIEAFRQEKAGIIKLTDSLVIRNRFRSIVDSSVFQLDIDRDSGEKLYDFIGQKRSIYELVYDMIIQSSNLATNIVIGFLGANNVNHTMHSLGAKNICVLRGVEDMKAYKAGLNNTTSALDQMIIYEKLALKEVVSPQASEKMINILFDQQHNKIIPAQLPSDVKVAHKTGSINGVRHDCGIVYLPDGRKYVLVLLSKDVDDSARDIEMLADISKKIYDFMTQAQ